MYIIKMMGGDKYKISEESFRKLEGKEGVVWIPEIGCAINISSIAAIFPDTKADEIEDVKDSGVGILHDGSRVRRHFGEWVDATTEVPDDKGSYKPVKLDPKYYPEVACDKVMGVNQWEKLEDKSLYYEVMGIDKSIPRLSGGFKPLFEIST